MRHKIRKVWDVVPLRQSFRPWNFSDNTIQVRTNTMHTCPPSLLRAPRCSTEEMSTPMRWSVLKEEKEAEQMFAWKYLIMPILTLPPRKEWMWWRWAKKCEKRWKWVKIQKCHIPNVEKASKPTPRSNNDAPSISKHGSPVLPDAQIVAPRAHCA